jgi:hypothetical protein
MRATLLLACAVFTAVGYAGTLTTSAYIAYDRIDTQRVSGTSRSDTGPVSFTIPDAAGDENFNGSATASAQYGILAGRAEMHGYLRSPHYVWAVAEATIEDLLSVTPGVSAIQLVFDVTGLATHAPGYANDAWAYIHLEFNHQLHSFFFEGDAQATTPWLSVPAGPVPMKVSFWMAAGGETGGIDDRVDAEADFSHTMILSGVNARDGSGNPLSNFSVIGDSGTNYLDVQSVPEPASIVLLMSGTALLFFGRRRIR